MATAAARADELLLLQRGALTDEEWSAFVPSVLAGFDEHDFAEILVWHGFGATEAEAWRQYRTTRVASAHFDLDGDRTEELFIYLGHMCGSSGCPTFIMRKSDGIWTKVGQLTTGSEEGVCVSDLRPDGFPLVYTYAGAVWWTGTAYEWMCLACEYPVPDNSRHDRLRSILSSRGWCQRHEQPSVGE
jgi:hypothetical protein